MEKDLRKFILQTDPPSREVQAKTRRIIGDIKNVSSRILSAFTNRLALERELFRIERGGLLPSHMPEDHENDSSEITSVGHVMQRLEDGSSITVMSKPFADDSPINGTSLIIEKQGKDPNPNGELEFETYYILDDEVLKTLSSSGSIARAAIDELTQLLVDVRKLEEIKPNNTVKGRSNVVQNLN